MWVVFKTPHIMLSILYHILLKYQFLLIFVIIFLFSHTATIVYTNFTHFFYYIPTNVSAIIYKCNKTVAKEKEICENGN